MLNPYESVENRRMDFRKKYKANPSVELLGVLDKAREEAFSLNHGYIGTEHLLLGIYNEPRIAQVLSSLGAPLVRSRAEVVDRLQTGDRVPVNPINITPRASRVVDLASLEAVKLGESSQDRSPKHLLLGLIKEGEGFGFAVLDYLTSISRIEWVFRRKDEDIPYQTLVSLESSRNYSELLSRLVILLDDPNIEDKQKRKLGKSLERLVDRFPIPDKP